MADLSILSLEKNGAMSKILKNLIPEFVKAPIRAYFHSRRASRSQAGQDLWVFGEVFDEKQGGFFLDVGANDGVELSNTYVLEKKYGWNGICIEANPEIFKQLRNHRRVTCVNACLDAGIGSVNFASKGLFGGIVSADTDNKYGGGAPRILTLQTVALGTLLHELEAPAEIDYFSIDIEGAEERVLGNFPFGKYRFKCMTIERPSTHLRALLKDNGYMLVKEIPGLDCFYVCEDFMDQYRSNLFSFYQKKWLTIGMG